MAGAPAGSAPDATLTTIVGRPFLTSQKFSEGGLYSHMYEEAKKVAEFRSTRIEAHPTILPKPFDGTYLVSYTIRPPQPRLHPQDVLFVKYNLIVRTCVVVQITNAGDAVTVYLVMNSNQYVAPPLPTRHDVSYTLDQLVKLNPSVSQVYQNKTFKDLNMLDPYFKHVVGEGVKTDTYDKPLAKSAHDGQVTRVPVTSLAGNTPMPVDDSQPFPIYGTVALEWERHSVFTVGQVSNLGHEVLKMS